MSHSEKHPFLQMITGVEGDVLWIMAVSSTAYTASEIARLSGRSKSQVQTVLYRLHALKIIDRTFYDGWSWNSLNEGHPFASHLREMATMKIETASIRIEKSAFAPSLWQTF